jgi:hypothetical protein
MVILIGQTGRVGAAGEDGMEEETPLKRQTQFCQAARTRRILDRLREGRAYDEVAREVALTERRVRQIVADHLKRREAVEGGAHAATRRDPSGRMSRPEKSLQALEKAKNGLGHDKARSDQLKPRAAAFAGDRVSDPAQDGIAP